MGDLGKFQAAVERSADMLMQELAKKAEKHADALTRATINGTPLGKYNGGSTKGQIKSFVEVDGDTLTGGVKSDYPNAIYQEFGTGPVGEAGGYPGDVPGIAYAVKPWWWPSGEEGQQIKADLHGGDKEDYKPYTYTRGQPPKAMFYNAIQAYGDEIAKDFGDTVLEVLRDE